MCKAVDGPRKKGGLPDSKIHPQIVQIDGKLSANSETSKKTKNDSQNSTERRTHERTAQETASPNLTEKKKVKLGPRNVKEALRTFGNVLETVEQMANDITFWVEVREKQEEEKDEPIDLGLDEIEEFKVVDEIVEFPNSTLVDMLEKSKAEQRKMDADKESGMKKKNNKKCVRFSNRNRVKRIETSYDEETISACFWSAEEVDVFRHTAFLEDCGLDPEDIDW